MIHQILVIFNLLSQMIKKTVATGFSLLLFFAQQG